MINTNSQANGPIILFDGICKFCHASIQFVIKRDRHKRFRFCPIQSVKGQQLMNQHGISESGLSSMILLEQNQVFFKSDAALRIAKKLTMPWPLLSLFIILPGLIRDGVYDFIGKRRYQWFGKYDHCWIPDDETRSRFLE